MGADEADRGPHHLRPGRRGSLAGAGTHQALQAGAGGALCRVSREEGLGSQLKKYARLRMNLLTENNTIILYQVRRLVIPRVLFNFP